MKLSRTSQHDKTEIESINFDVMIVSSGYEARARYLVQHSRIHANHKYCLCFDKYTDEHERVLNDEAFSNLGFELIISSGNSETEVDKILRNITNGNKLDKLNILIDYTSMTRVWYAAAIKYFFYSQDIFREVSLYFSYSCSKFSLPPNPVIYNRVVGPIDGFYSLSIPNKPTALIIGLGYVESRAYGLAEFFDVDPHLFIADPSSNKEFYYEVLSKNEKLIQAVGKNNLFLYPLQNLIYTETLLYHFALDLFKSYRVVIAPCGPKPFTLISLLMFLRLKEIDVWRISAGDDDVPANKIANGDFIIYQALLSSH